MKITQNQSESSILLRHLKNLREIQNNSTRKIQVHAQIQDRQGFGSKVKPGYYNKKQTYEQDRQSWIKFCALKIHDLKEYTNLLYQSSSYKDASLYGLSINLLDKGIGKNERGGLNILWGFYQTLGWQSISICDIEQYVINFPRDQNQVEQIAIENNLIKLNKLGTSLVFNILAEEYYLEDKKYELNRQAGRNYQRSLSKITYQFNSYQFEAAIRQIESNSLLIAVRTDDKLFVINPQGTMKSFNLKTRDIKLLKNRCLYAQKDGSIGSIFMQNSFKPKINEVALEEVIYADRLYKAEFLVSNDNLVLIVQINLEEQIIAIRKVEKQRATFPFHIAHQQGEFLVKKQGFIRGDYLYILLFLGRGKNITQIFEYKFFIFDI